MQLFLKSVAIANLRHRILQGNMGINSVLGNSGCPTSLWMETQGTKNYISERKMLERCTLILLRKVFFSNFSAERVASFG